MLRYAMIGLLGLAGLPHFAGAQRPHLMPLDSAVHLLAAAGISNRCLVDEGVHTARVLARISGFDYLQHAADVLRRLQTDSVAPKIIREIMCGEIRIGHPKKLVPIAWGEADAQTESKVDSGILTVWTYKDGRSVTFGADGKVTSVTNVRR